MVKRAFQIAQFIDICRLHLRPTSECSWERIWDIKGTLTPNPRIHPIRFELLWSDICCDMVGNTGFVGKFWCKIEHIYEHKHIYECVNISTVYSCVVLAMPSGTERRQQHARSRCFRPGYCAQFVLRTKSSESYCKAGMDLRLGSPCGFQKWYGSNE